MGIDRQSVTRGLKFLREIEQLKNVLRSAHTSEGRAESTAEHTWRLAMMVLVFSDDLPDDFDVLKLLKMCLIHDLGETYAGDVPAIHQTEGDGRKAIERADMEKLCAILGGTVGADIMKLWEEYEAGETVEAVYAKGFDKIETILQHTQGANAADFDYAFNLTYGTERTNKEPLLEAVRAPVDEATCRRGDGLEAWPK